MAPLKTCLIGAGNWASAISMIVGETVLEHDEFDNTVTMWVYEEMFNGRKLSEIINTDHENAKYLPGKKLPPNIVANPDLHDSIRDADILVFVIPHQFVPDVLQHMKGHVKKSAIGLSLVKTRAVFTPFSEEDEGLEIRSGGGIKLIADLIKETLNMDTYVLMGASLARNVAADDFCEATIGGDDLDKAEMLKKLLQGDNFKIGVVDDAHTVELCAALKNVVACAAGFADGMGHGDNTKAAVIRIGFMEMTRFVEYFYPGSNLETFFESCGIANLITTCRSSRSQKVCDAIVTTGKPLHEVEEELLDGQSLQGPHTAAQVNCMLKAKKMEHKFPLFTAVHKICVGEMQPKDMIKTLRHR